MGRQECFENEEEKEQQGSGRVQHRCRNLFRDCQLRPFLPRTTDVWPDIRYSDCGTVSVGGIEK